MNLEDIKKLTVADLKKELKSRNLPVSGVKPELMQRLTDSIIGEHQILDHSGDQPADESLLDEDEVLGLSSSTTTTPTIPSLPRTNLPKNPIPQSITIAAKPTETVGIGSTQAATIGATSAKPTGDASESGEPKKIRLKPSISSEGETDTTAATAPAAAATLDPAQAKIERAKKFNLPLKEDDKKKLRADRFGTGGDSKTAASSVASSKVTSDPDTLKKRADRFGISAEKASSGASVQDDGKLKQRAERFGIQSKTDQGTNGVGGGTESKEKILKRQLRFGSGGGGKADSEEVAAKKKARAERFGMK